MRRGKLAIWDGVPRNTRGRLGCESRIGQWVVKLNNGATLPIPPHNQFVHLLLFVNIFEQIKDCVVELFGVSDGVTPGEYRGRRERKADLETGSCQMAKPLYRSG